MTRKYRPMYGGCLSDPSELAVDLSYPWVVLDTETTGLNIGVDRVIEIGMVWGKGTEIWGEYSQRFCPRRPVGDSYAIHGIADVDLVGLEAFGSWRVPRFAGLETLWEGNALFWCYNVAYDARMVLAETHIAPERGRWRELALLLPLCGLPREYESGRRYRPPLKKACQSLGITNKKAHSALEDARASAQILVKAVEATGAAR